MVANINLDMSPTQARNALEAAGYNRTSTTRDTDSSSENPTTWTYKKGASTIDFARVDNEISAISELYIRTDGTQFDVQAEYNAVKRYFSVGDNEQGCKPPSTRGALCAVVDGQPHSVLFGVQILPSMKTTQLQRVYRK
jgi:hypothetical protein